MELHIYKDYNELSEHLADWMVEYICKTLSTKERFSIVLTGGSTPKKLYEILASDEYKNKIDWSCVNVFIRMINVSFHIMMKRRTVAK